MTPELYPAIDLLGGKVRDRIRLYWSHCATWRINHPSWYKPAITDLDGVKAVQTAMMNHCELMGDRVAILDAPPAMNAQQIRDWRQKTAGYDSKYATLYWPWIKVLDPVSGRNVNMPPSGHMAGVWSRNDDTRGVFKAPANEIILGAVGVDYAVTRGEMDLLNPMGVNSIKSFPGRGIRVWGGRTLSSDAEWRYINVRRYFNYLDQYANIHAISTVGSWILGVAFLMMALNLLASLKTGKPAPNNPWGGTTLEWETSSPPITHNFHTQPVLEHEPYDYRHRTATHV